ncbi:biopolymer transporter ExbD [Herbaspirillum sp. SJZ099]|uniref:ExbD/TolR family protein n=1 Tax=Herbaspirillum sp. SJZ099 TaxID=2572916 RepID=UPI0011A3735A|nr:biopolymer transporter ExbD [Herbaspirillum sp. SJZ099]TWC67372.1 outer membrane transport energization protein ExbD [Herbaspirillum sp. SJZ099]
MRSWGETEKRRARIEIIPMIDVMMFLLVFFVLLSLNVIPAMGVKTSLPSSSSTSNLQTLHIARITLGLDGELQLEGRDIAAGALVPGLQQLQAGEPGKKLTLIVNADQKVEFQRVIDLMDTLKGNGFDAISFVSRRK